MLHRDLPAQDFTWPSIVLTRDEGEVFGGVDAQIRPFGKYCRSRPLVFSFEPRCQGLAGSQKYTGMRVRCVKS